MESSSALEATLQKYFDNHMVAHVWAQQNQDEGYSHNRNFYFESDAIYSYGRHFMVARFVTNKRGEKIVLLTVRNRSSSTSAHTSMARNAVRGQTVIEVVDPGSSDHNTHRAEFIERAKERLDSAKKARRVHLRSNWMGLAGNIVAEANQYAAFFGLRWNLALETIDADAQKLAQAVKREEAKVARQREKAEQARRAEALAKAELWKAGEGDYFSGASMLPVMLRVVGDTLESSHGAEVPLKHAKRVFEAAKKCRAAKQEWHRNGKTLPVGHFQIDHIGIDGALVAGCHRIAWEEIARVAQSIGLSIDA